MKRLDKRRKYCYNVEVVHINDTISKTFGGNHVKVANMVMRSDCDADTLYTRRSIRRINKIK